MSKHTPGPWFPYFSTGLKKWTVQCGKRWIAVISAAIDDDEEAREDAHFMAAAPDLADVAHMVLTTATVYTPPELVKAATDALRKAGEIPGEEA